MSNIFSSEDGQPIKKNSDTHHSKDYSDKEVKKLIKEALKYGKKAGATKRIQSEEDLQYVAGLLSEFLDCFVVLGYDIDGNGIEIYAATNQQQSASLKMIVSEAAIKLNS